MFLSKLLTRKSQSGCYDRGRNVYTFWKICYEMNMDVSMDKKLYDEENYNIRSLFDVYCSEFVRRSNATLDLDRRFLIGQYFSLILNSLDKA